MKAGVESHVKFKKLKMRLRMPVWQIKGILESIWNFTAANTLQGDIGRYSNEDIAACIEWEDDPDSLITALIETGWLDECQVHRLIVHDWVDHCPQYIKGNLAKHGKPFARVSTKQPAKEGAKEGAKQPTEHAAGEGATKPILSKPIQTKPIQTKPKQRTSAHSVPSDFSISENLKSWAKKEGINSPEKYIAEFVDYWKGEGNKKSDWHATFRNYLRSRKEKGWHGGLVHQQAADAVPIQCAADMSRVALEDLPRAL